MANHIWKKYSISTVGTGEYELVTSDYIEFICNAVVGEGASVTLYYKISLDSSTGAITLSGYDGTLVFENPQLPPTGWSDSVGSYLEWDGQYYKIYGPGPNDYCYNHIGGLGAIANCNASGTVDGQTNQGLKLNRVYAEEQTEQVKGTYISDVTSTSSTTYPTNGISGNYWYVYQGTDNEAPTTPSNITVPSSITEGTTISISWGASTDSNSNLSGYILQCKLNSGSWTQVYKGTSRSYTYSVPIGTETITFRVKAYDSDGAESSYKTSSTVNVVLDSSKLTFIEYIESTGTQYIDTLYIPTNNTRVLLDAQITQGETGEKQLFGLRESTSGPFLTFFLTTDNKISSRWRETAIKTFSSSDTIYERHTFDRNQNTATYDGETLTWEDTEFTFSYTLPLLCRKTGTTIDEHIKAKVYSCQIYENDTLVRDFQPAINLNGEAGLYDAVNNKFYKNAGSGAFTVPRLYDSLPSGYILATYIEASGSQYIDTGVIPSTDIGIEVDFMLTTEQSSSSTGGIVSVEQVWPSNMYSIDAWAYRYGTAYKTHTLTPNVKYHSVLQNGIFYQDGVAILTGANGKASTIPLYMFAVNTPSGAKEYANARIYYCKLYSGGSLVRDYLPCVEEATGKIGMFDLQDGIFYPFQGTYTVKAVVEGAINGYVNIGGVHKKILREYENINGVLKLGSDWQTNINGVLKSSSYEQEYTYDLGVPVYTWKKYGVNETEGAPYTQTKSSEGTIATSYAYYWVANSFSFDTSTGKYTLTSPSLKARSYIKTSSYKYFQMGTSSGSSYTSPYSAKNYMRQTTKSTSPSLATNATTGEQIYMTTGYQYTATPSIIYSQGTYIEDVTSTNASAYPTNGKHTDGYWYVKQ